MLRLPEFMTVYLIMEICLHLSLFPQIIEQFQTVRYMQICNAIFIIIEANKRLVLSIEANVTMSILERIMNNEQSFVSMMLIFLSLSLSSFFLRIWMKTSCWITPQCDEKTEECIMHLWKLKLKLRMQRMHIKINQRLWYLVVYLNCNYNL